MRKAQKLQVEDLVKTLEEAQVQIKKAIEKKDISLALDLLENCQTGAITLGTLIEESEGEGFITVVLLEEYCEQIYQIHEGLIQNASANVDKIYKRLRSMLLKIEQSVKYDIKVRLEVVFLPYKASMWDSLESVWKAADEDPCCDAYVIPIPYYDKNVDGTFGEMHYEGEQYPEYVPITWYEDYDFAQNQPDMIFIHNPYDGYNRVTSVHPFFYSKNLKQFTKQLVYIPYFVHQNDKVEEKYCLLPGTMYANTVVLQSKRVKEQYVKYYMNFVKDQQADVKFQVLGSPKLDSANYDSTNIPDEWNDLIYKNGVRRKVVFLNTHLVCLTKAFHQDFFIKIEEIFQYFRNNEDAVLLWRPHPLSVASANAMNPQVKQKYMDLVEGYKKENFGIYDDSSDIHRAVFVADAFYGNKSSVTEMFRALGKPVMIMNLRIHG